MHCRWSTTDPENEAMKIVGAVALVTGGASGIGKAVCEKLLKGGAKVCKLTMSNEEANK